MNYKLLTLCLSLLVAAVNVSAQPQKRGGSPDSTDATSAKRAHVDTVVSPVGGPATAIADSTHPRSPEREPEGNTTKHATILPEDNKEPARSTYTLEDNSAKIVIQGVPESVQGTVSNRK